MRPLCSCSIVVDVIVYFFSHSEALVLVDNIVGVLFSWALLVYPMHGELHEACHGLCVDQQNFGFL